MQAVLVPGSRHPIAIRNPRLDFDASIPRHWMAGMAPATHFFNGMNLVFPDGERFFIRAVRDCLSGVADPGLREQVRGFAGQEGRHATEEIEHKAVAFDVLRATHPSQALRVLGFLLATLALFDWTIAGARTSSPSPTPVWRRSASTPRVAGSPREPQPGRMRPPAALPCRANRRSACASCS